MQYRKQPHADHLVMNSSLNTNTTLTRTGNLSHGAPDALEESVALGQSVQSIVALTHRSHETAEGVDVVLSLDLSAVLVDLGDGDLDGGVVLGLDDAVGGAALSGDVQVHNLSLVVFHLGYLLIEIS